MAGQDAAPISARPITTDGGTPRSNPGGEPFVNLRIRSAVFATHARTLMLRAIGALETGSCMPERRPRSNVEFRAGEFVLAEQRPRVQSRTEVVPLGQGEGVIFPVHYRSVHRTRGTDRVTMRPGVSRVRSGHPHTVGIIFDDAK